MVPRIEHCHAQLSGTVVVFMEPGVVRKRSEPVAVSKLARTDERRRLSRRRERRSWCAHL